MGCAPTLGMATQFNLPASFKDHEGARLESALHHKPYNSREASLDARQAKLLSAAAECKAGSAVHTCTPRSFAFLADVTLNLVQAQKQEAATGRCDCRTVQRFRADNLEHLAQVSSCRTITKPESQPQSFITFRVSGSRAAPMSGAGLKLSASSCTSGMYRLP